jgi:hypothetical protein
MSLVKSFAVGNLWYILHTQPIDYLVYLVIITAIKYKIYQSP